MTGKNERKMKAVLDGRTERNLRDRTAVREAAPDTNQTRMVLFLEECIRADFNLTEALEDICFGLMEILCKGYIPAAHELYELTAEQYVKFYATARKDAAKSGERIFILLPKNPALQFPSREVETMTESQVSCLFKAAKVIKQYRRDFGKHFDSITEELSWLAAVLPAEFSGGGKYGEP
ncbi:hypothetical protein FACS1894124_0870 [Spirochaetia bacterium]|nr:hypothetical protein FACS1894124_0870 [Spirochaetia bacterium]